MGPGPAGKEEILKRSVGLAVCLVSLMTMGAGQGREFVDQVGGPVKDAIEIRQKTQAGADDWAAEKARLSAEFETLTRETEQLAEVHRDLQQTAVQLTSTVDGLARDLDRVTRISDEMLPFLEDVYTRLSDLVGEDVPFLAEERRGRIQALRKVLDDPESSVSERFRKTMESLAIEAEYGHTIEVYQEKIFLNGTEMLVDVFRLGRLALFFQSLDQKTTGYFDPSGSVWKVLPRKYNRDLLAAVEIGAKRRSADLLNLPLGRIATK